MMRWISLLLLLLPLAVAPAARNDKPVSLVIDDAPVAQVLQALAEMNHKNLVVAPDVSGTLSLASAEGSLEPGAAGGSG